MTATTDLQASIRGLLDACYRGNRESWGPLLDVLADAGATDADLRWMRRVNPKSRPSTESAELLAVRLGAITPADCPSNRAAGTLHTALTRALTRTVPVMTTDRCLPRKEQARLLRLLCKQLGIPGLSVTAPSYSMASTVDVTYPARIDHPPAAEGGRDFLAHSEAWAMNREIERMLETLLARAFPAHDDRSDYQSDYYNFCWSLHAAG